MRVILGNWLSSIVCNVGNPSCHEMTYHEINGYADKNFDNHLTPASLFSSCHGSGLRGSKGASAISGRCVFARPVCNGAAIERHTMQRPSFFTKEDFKYA